MNDQLEQAIAASIEPLVDTLVAMEKRVASLTLVPGPQGDPGKDAPAVDVDAVARTLADTLKASPELVLAVAGETAFTLKSDKDFQESLRGERGEPGEPGRPGENGAAGLGLFSEVWKTGNVHRAGDVVTAHLGQYFKATRDTADAPGSSDAWERVGLAGLRFVGIKPEGDTLKDGDLYIDGGSLFHFDGERARMWVQRGKTGPQGEAGTRGAHGSDGKDAPRIVALEATAKGLVLVLDDGQLIDADITGLQDLIASEVDKADKPPDGDAVRVRWFRGDFDVNKTYRAGDVVRKGRALWLAILTPSRGAMAEGEWIKWGAA